MKLINLAALLYECEIWFVTLGEEHRLSAFKNKVLRRILGPMGQKKQQEYGQKYIMATFLILIKSNSITMNKLRKVKWVGNAAHIGDMSNTYRIFV
jgi:hypothetical protein